MLLFFANGDNPLIFFISHKQFCLSQFIFFFHFKFSKTGRIQDWIQLILFALQLRYSHFF